MAPANGDTILIKKTIHNNITVNLRPDAIKFTLQSEAFKVTL